jgi:hypothetical protein
MQLIAHDLRSPLWRTMPTQFIIQKLHPAAIKFFRFLGGMRHEILIPHTVGRYTITSVHFERKANEKPRLQSSSGGVFNGCSQLNLLSFSLKRLWRGAGLLRRSSGGNLMHFFAVVRLVNAHLKKQIDYVARAPVEGKP